MWRKSNASLIYSLPFVAHTHSLGLKRMGVVSLGSDSVCTYLCICYRNSTFPPLTCPPLSLYLSSPFLAQATSSKRAIKIFVQHFTYFFSAVGCPLPFLSFLLLMVFQFSRGGVDLLASCFYSCFCSCFSCSGFCVYVLVYGLRVLGGRGVGGFRYVGGWKSVRMFVYK